MDRFLVWLSAGVVTAGVSAAMVVGAGIAAAETGSGSGSDANGTTSAESTKLTENKADSHTDGLGKPKTKPSGDKPKKDVAADVDDEPAAEADPNADTEDVAEEDGRKAAKPETGKRAANLINNFVAAMTHKPDRKAVVEKADPVDRVEKVETVEAVDPVETVGTEATITTEPETAALEAAQTNLVIQRTVNAATFSAAESNVTLATPMLARSEVTESAAPPLRVPPVVSLIGTAVFGLISFAESVFEGPPMVPPGSKITVRRSTLTIGNGHEVPADWYFPEGSYPDSDTPPERIIYLQHGFLVRGVFYDYTAAYLAEHTNSIVIAPTVTSNIFATDGYWLGGDQMHRAVADLFLDDNDALLKSAQAAGYEEDELPQRVVLVGHSLGGGLVLDTAGYMVDNGTSGKLAGVVMLDGVAFTDPAPALREILETIPVYNLSATPYFWNLFGGMDAALAEVRPDVFHGAQLVGGLHSDSMLGGNPLVQFGAYLLTGFSLPRNVEASQILMAGWISDMFEGTETPGLYGDPGSTLTIPTSAGNARALVQPTPGVLSSLAREVTAAFFRLFANIDFATCAAADPQETGFLREMSTPNTPLSLDGRARTGQSVGQHVCTG